MNLAIIIGVENYDNDDFINLKACDNDAELFKNVISDIKVIDDAIYLNKSPSAYDVKKQISDFVEKHKNSDIDELIFYFSGHGSRSKDDFFYVLSDFNESKKESTGLRNTELDGLIRTLNPKLTVKIIDACFSGTQYIKSDTNTQVYFEKSAKENRLNDIYFWFSSRENQTSLAGVKFSKFTESIFRALLNCKDEVRYRDVMAYVADDLSAAGLPKPVFITQADNIEKFGTITDNTHQIILKAFGLDAKPKEIKSTEPAVGEKQESSLLSLVSDKSESEFCTEKDLLDRLKLIKDKISETHWPDDLTSIYKIALHELSRTYDVPNSEKIGLWLEEKDSKEYFSKPSYTEKSFEVEEYRALPKKPSLSPYASIARMARMFNDGDDTEYKLETVTKTKRVISGFDNTYKNENNILKITFEPKYISIKPICIFIINIFSKTELVIHFSYEFLKYTDWETESNPLCEKWHTKFSKARADETVDQIVGEMISEISSWAVENIRNSLEE